MNRESNLTISAVRSCMSSFPSLRALLLVTVLGMVVLVTGTSAAQGAFGIANFDGAVANRDGTPATQAGAHPYSAMTTFDFNTVTNNGAVLPDGAPKDIRVDLPAGFIGNPTATTRCGSAAFAKDTPGFYSFPECPASSVVGIAAVRIAVLGSVSTTYAPVYNLQPPPGVPGQFGFAVTDVRVRLNATVRSAGDYGVSIELVNVPQGVALAGSAVTFWGVPADPSHDDVRGTCLNPNSGESTGSTCPSQAPIKPFLTNPTDCATGPLTTTLAVDPWENPGAYQTATFVSHDNYVPSNPVAPSGCERVPFAGSLSAQPSSSQAGAPSGLAIDLSIPQNENPDGISTATLKKVVVRLPRGVTVSPSSADGLGACSESQVGIGSAATAACPDASKIGTVQVDTPLLEQPLQGSVYLAQQGNNPFGSLLALYVVAEGSGVVIKLPGEVQADPVTGQLTTTFDNNPQLPFTDLKLELKGGPRAPLVNPPECGTYTTESELTSWTGKAIVSDSSFSIVQGEGGGACPTEPFAPVFSAGAITPQAGAFSPFSLVLSRTDADQKLGALSVRTPPGLLGVLKGVVQCPEPQASQGTCGPESLIGHTTVGAGPGSSPFNLGGRVFLTGPYKGAPFGLSVVVPAIAGPFNLGTVVVRASIAVDPTTAQLIVTSDPLPQILQGIPLDLRTIGVTIDRVGFMFNPTDCNPLAVSGVVQSSQSTNIGVSSRFQVANCAALPFKPGFSAATQGATSKANGASLSVKVSSGAGQANIGKVLVSLPKQLPSRLTTLQKACVAAVFEANPAGCPAASVVGSATAVTPILAHPLTGPAYLVSHGGEAFPDLVIVLQAEGIRIDLDGKTNIKNGITSNSFNTVPDAPISSFALSLPEGPHSVLATNLPAKANRSMCGQSLTMPTTLTGQNGAVVKQTTKMSVAGCPRAKGKSKVRKKGAAKSRVGRRGVVKGSSSSQK